jgi:hypothetical protein
MGRAAQVLDEQPVFSPSFRGIFGLGRWGAWAAVVLLPLTFLRANHYFPPSRRTDTFGTVSRLEVFA